MESTDTPDFFYDDNDSRARDASSAASRDIEEIDNPLKKKKAAAHNPGVAGALDVNPDMIGGYVSASAEAAGVKFELDIMAKNGRFEQEVSVDVGASSSTAKEVVVTIKPVCMGFEDFYAGFTPETPNIFSVEPTQGRMERRGGAPTSFKVKLTPNNKPGEYIGYLCVVLPEENEQFTVKVTGKQF